MSFPDAWRALDGLLCADRETNLPVDDLDVDQVYMGEPGAGHANGAIYVTTVPDLLSGDSYDFKIRVYVNLDSDAIDRQLDWVEAVESVEALLTAEWPRGDWSFGYDRQLDRLVAEMTTGTNRP